MKYEVTVNVEAEESIIVEARSEKEAEEKAMVYDGELQNNLDCISVTGIDSIKKVIE